MPQHTSSARASSARVSPDRPAVAFFTITLVAVVFLASFVFSFAAIADAAAWTGAPLWARWLAPVFIDGAILTYTCSLAIVRHRGQSPRRSLFFLYSFTGISVAVNFAHAGAAWAWDFGRLETWFGCLIGIAAPLAALFAADEATRLVFTRDTAHSAQAATEPVAEVVAEPVAAEPEPEAMTLAERVDDPDAALAAMLTDTDTDTVPDTDTGTDEKDAPDTAPDTDTEQAAAAVSPVVDSMLNGPITDSDADAPVLTPAPERELEPVAAAPARRQSWTVDDHGRLITKELTT